MGTDSLLCTKGYRRRAKGSLKSWGSSVWYGARKSLRLVQAEVALGGQSNSLASATVPDEDIGLLAVYLPMDTPLDPLPHSIKLTLH